MMILENQVYDTAIGERGLYDLILPCSDGEACDVLFIYIHGGGIQAGTKNDQRAVLEKVCENKTMKIACASVNYRMFPDGVKFPVFIEDCAKAVAVIREAAGKHCPYKKIIVGGSSAGGYLSMMLYFDPQYLAKYEIAPDTIDGWFFDAGQPTTHFGILASEGIHPQCIRVDEAAPLFFVDHPYEQGKKYAKLHFIWSEFDMDTRPAQSRLMVDELLLYGFPRANITETFMKNAHHCEYVGNTELFSRMICSFAAEVLA